MTELFVRTKTLGDDYTEEIQPKATILSAERFYRLHSYGAACCHKPTHFLNGEQLQTVIVHCEKYFWFKTKSELTAAEQIKFKIFTQTTERIPVSDESDIERVRTLKANVYKKAEALADVFHDLEKRYTTYSKIFKTYYEISQEDYISKLAEQERQWRENKNHKKVL